MTNDSKKLLRIPTLLFLRFYNLKTILTLVFFFILALVFHFSSPNIPDPDSFYHIKHAQIYRAQGVTSSEFPWAQYSAIKINSSDIWYGFHILLIPFSIFDGTLGIKLAGVFLTFFTLTSFWFVLKRHQIKWPVFWPIFVFISAPNIMNRFLMMRPHLLSLALTILLFSCLILGRRTAVFAIAVLFSWVHISLVWIPLLVFGVVFLLKRIIEKIWIWREGLILLAGTAVGWLLRPNPIGSLKLAYIQVAQLMLEKQNDYSLLFGRELFPLAPQTLFQNFSAFMLLWIPAIAVMFALAKKHPDILKNVRMLSAGILSLVFFALTILVARRAHDFWVPFGTIFIALVYTHLARHANIFKNVRMISVIALACVFAFLIIYTPWRNSISLEERAIAPNKFKEAALWLKENSQPGDIVFNLRWSDFPMLFFWNDKNYYIGGMDPIFQYAYDAELYWKFHYLSADQVTKYTCPAPACTKDMMEDTYTVLKNDFKAKYVFLEKQRNPLVYYYLESTPERYIKKIDTVSEAVYEIK